MSFNVSTALQVCTANLNNRAQSRSITYILYYTNNQESYAGKMHGATIKELIEKFRREGGAYRYAFITKQNDDKVLRFFNRDVSKKFFSMTRTGKRKK